MTADTIYALSSGRPPSAIAVIRVSGSGAHRAAERLAGVLPPPRQATLRLLRHPDTGELLDEALVLRFDEPASATGEDLVELHCHGGRAVVDAVLDAIGTAGGTREAQPGEFTRRAFENGRIDLTAAEGLADLLAAETESQRKTALALAEGGLSALIADWQDRLLGLAARAERAIDYVDEDGAEEDHALPRDCNAFASELQSWLDRPRIEPLKEGIRVVVGGPPNAGKSSLVNAVAGTERAIVTDVPGTTRDYIEVPLSLTGVPILLTDTAGIRATDDHVEAIGVQRAATLAGAADILIWIGAPDEAPPHDRRLVVHGKADLPEAGGAPPGSFAVSALTGQGVSELLEAVAALVRTLVPADGALALNRRQASTIEEAHQALARAARESDPILVAENLRSARVEFDRLTGRAGVEDVLDALFGRFCLGK